MVDHFSISSRLQESELFIFHSHDSQKINDTNYKINIYCREDLFERPLYFSPETQRVSRFSAPTVQCNASFNQSDESLEIYLTAFKITGQQLFYIYFGHAQKSQGIKTSKHSCHLGRSGSSGNRRKTKHVFHLKRESQNYCR